MGGPAALEWYDISSDHDLPEWPHLGTPMRRNILGAR